MKDLFGVNAYEGKDRALRRLGELSDNNDDLISVKKRKDVKEERE